MTYEERIRLNKSFYYHKGCLEFREKQLEIAKTDVEIDNIKILIKQEKEKISEIENKLYIK